MSFMLERKAGDGPPIKYEEIVSVGDCYYSNRWSWNVVLEGHKANCTVHINKDMEMKVVVHENNSNESDERIKYEVRELMGLFCEKYRINEEHIEAILGR